MVSISAIIIARNEEDRIGAAIASLSCCDEVVVVDSGSTDRTREIAGSWGARVISREWDGYSRQKNFAAAQAQHDWILSVDADERISIELSEEILRWKSRPIETDAVSMPRRVFYMGGWINHSGWYPDRKIRLYDRRMTCWEGDFVHESLRITARTAGFEGDLLHFPYRDWKDHRERVDRYTRLAAEAAKTQGRRGNLLRLAIGPPASFAKTFLLGAGFLDGWRGAAIAYAAARYVFLRELRILR